MIEPREEEWDDEQLLAQLGEALHGAGPVPDAMLTAGHAAYTWRRIDEELELATLVYDSDLDLAADLALRGSAAPRTVVFDAAGLSVELEVDPHGIRGQLQPPGPGQVSVVAPQGPAYETSADDRGWFEMPVLSSGPVHLSCRRGSATLVTDWIRFHTS